MTMNKNTASIDSVEENEGHTTIHLKWEGPHSIEEFELSMLGTVAACGEIEPGVGWVCISGEWKLPTDDSIPLKMLK